MRAELTPVVVSAVYLFAGAGVMAASGLVRSGREALAAAGMAYVAGLVAVLLIGTWLLAAGVPVDAPVVALISGVVGVGGFAVALRRRKTRKGQDGGGALAAVPGLGASPAAGRRYESVLIVLLSAGLIAVAVLGYLAAQRMLLTEWDAWSIWTRKARILLEFGTPSLATFTSSHYGFMHPDYPLLLPLMESFWFRVTGFPDTSSLHAQFWLLFVASLGAAAWVVRRAGARALVCLALVGLIAVTPGIRTQLLTMYADVPTALLLGLGALLLGRWLQDGQRRELALAALMLAGAANIKNEGLSGSAVLFLAAIVVAAAAGAPGWRSRLRAIAPPLVAGVGVLVTVLPWRVWLAVNDIHGDMPVGDGLDPAFLADRADRVRPAIDGLIGPMSDQGTWLYLVPLGAGAVILGLLSSELRRISAFYGISGLLLFGSLVWAFWISPNELSWHLSTAAGRVIVAVVLVAAVATLHIAAEALTPRTVDAEAGHGSDAGRAERDGRAGDNPAG